MRRCRTEAGDTLVEVVFALLILSSVLVGSFALIRVSRGNTQNSLLRSQAINMVQEQYNALRDFRDNNPQGWTGFVGAASCVGACSNYTLGVAGASSNAFGGGAACNPTLAATLTNCIFHMERDPRPGSGSSYGQWVPCPGSWHPAFDNDTTWNTFTATGSYSSALLLNKGCAGDDRTFNDPTLAAYQPNIQVSIQLASPDNGCNSTQLGAFGNGSGASFYSFNITGTWKEGGIVGTATTTLSTVLADVKGPPFC